jgi:molecular chaperone GrpE
MTDEHNEEKKDGAGTTEESEVEKLKRQCEEYLNGWKRAKADLINYQKDEAKRFDDLVKFGNKDLIREFIPVLDSFDLALSVLEKEGKVEKGVYMIRGQFEDVLRKQGLERMAVSIGAPFNPQLHESVGEMAADVPEGTIAAEIERGYTLHGKVVRPARVKLARGNTQ